MTKDFPQTDIKSFWVSYTDFHILSSKGRLKKDWRYFKGNPQLSKQSQKAFFFCCCFYVITMKRETSAHFNSSNPVRQTTL